MHPDACIEVGFPLRDIRTKETAYSLMGLDLMTFSIAVCARLIA
jgi:hypothetical protein